MGILMPSPFKRGETYYLRVHVPRDIAAVAEGTRIAIPVGDAIQTVIVRGTVVTFQNENNGYLYSKEHTAAASGVSNI